MIFDIIVVGGGHAGCEAAYAASKKNCRVGLITMNKANIADMPCNPSIGGTAKGIIVREIDALGGIMGKIADESHFQIKMLNNSKGPAVRSLRAQIDKMVYPKKMLEMLNKIKNLQIIEGMVEDLIVEDKNVKGVILSTGEKIYCSSVILTTGTYLKSNILVGSSKTEGGPHGEQRSNSLSDNLLKNGITIQRLKTGTPPRIKKDSIDFSVMQTECGDNQYHTFSFDNQPKYNINNQQRCYLLYTNNETHQIIRDNLTKSSMYGGLVEGIGPRYCPSIEDKIVRFSDKERHQLFLEPESIYYDEWYLQGFSTSMPIDIQEKLVHSLKGLEKAIITKYAYAIEYDAIDPQQMKFNLESKIISGLFTAGQINGTSGYEEAAAQGLIAGINAAQKIHNQSELILKRSDSYIGVLIDDLVTKGTREPYRMLTSRAEFRLILRNDNADLRLRRIGYNFGMIDEDQIKRLNDKEKIIDQLLKYLKETKLDLSKANLKFFSKEKIPVPSNGISLYNILKRPEINISFLKNLVAIEASDEICDIIQTLIKYEGYIEKSYKEVEKLLKLESKQIPQDIDYNKIKNIASEARQKLNKVRPVTLAQASRISGINPSDISILAVYLRKEYGKDEQGKIS